MAIETGAIFKKLYFDGQSSGDYGVYISGAGTFNAPVRDIEMVSIPGRNGALALDKGRFENPEVTYKAGLFGVDEADFADAISDFRNFLCSRDGYVRLEDDYNPNEYRMAVYKNGLNVDLATLEAGEFDITFDCKPQRWLVSGETAVTVASGDTLTNPTLFESSPLLEVEGYGTIGFNGYEIELENAQLGQVALLSSDIDAVGSLLNTTVTLGNTDVLQSGDEITVANAVIALESFTLQKYSSSTWYTQKIISITVTSCTGVDGCSATATRTSGSHASISVFFPTLTFEYGTPLTYTVTTVTSIQISGAGYVSATFTNTVEYDGASALTFRVTHSTDDNTYRISPSSRSRHVTASAPTGYSTQSLLGHPTYIDCDLGEAYKYEGTSLISLNRHIDLGSDLPKLASGENEVTFDNTVTELTVTPRWWRI